MVKAKAMRIREQEATVEHHSVGQQQALIDAVRSHFSEVPAPRYLQTLHALAARRPRWDSFARGLFGVERRSGWDLCLEPVMSDSNAASDWYAVGRDILAAVDSYTSERNCIEDAGIRREEPAAER